MLYKERVNVYCEDHTEHITIKNASYGQSAEFVVSAGGAYSNDAGVKGSVSMTPDLTSVVRPVAKK